jgi:hypothetical protein
MKITLLSSGLELEVPIAGEKKGRDRMIQAFERAAAGRKVGELKPQTPRLHGTFRSQLLSADEGSQVSTASYPNANPEPINRATMTSADDLAKSVYAALELDVVGDEVRCKLRRLVSRQVNERWIQDEKAGRHNRSAAEQQEFRDDIDAGTETAVRAYAALRLGNPTALQVDLAGARANPANRS